MQLFVCDKCGQPARIGKNLLASFVQDNEKGEGQCFDYQFDLCDQCAMGIVREIQVEMQKRTEAAQE